MYTKEFKTKVGEIEIKAIVSDLAKNASGSIIIEVGDTKVLVTAATSSRETTLDYFPLTVDYEERFYAAGMILGSRFMRREGRPSGQATLNARMIDRTIRPLFPKSYKKEVHVVVTVLSIGDYSPEVCGIIGASIALSCSEIPWSGPVSAVKLYKLNTEWDFTSDKQNLEGECTICGNSEGVTMIEAEGTMSENAFSGALNKAKGEIETLQNFQREIIKEIGKEKLEIKKIVQDKDIENLFTEKMSVKMSGIYSEDKGVYDLKDEWREIVMNKGLDVNLAMNYFEDTIEDYINKQAVEQNAREDGRKPDEVRLIFAKAGGFANKIHGTGIFYRGDTHVFTALTLGGPEDSLLIDTMEKNDCKEYFFHHYNFPPYAAGEPGRMIGPNRRMLGHGALAEKSIRPVLPSQQDFPYTIRLVSECLSSNGSTSMASVCASSLALMDGGVPIKEHVAGIAMGIMKYNDKYVILTDIQGPEDHYGGMDLKVAGTNENITSIQMDTKLHNIPYEIIIEATKQAGEARRKILKVMSEEIVSPRENISSAAPNIKKIMINPSFIGQVIGSGGKTIKDIKEKTMVKEITIEDDGSVIISGDADSVAAAAKRISSIAYSFEVGELFDGEVITITDFGVFARIMEGHEGLVHISELSNQRVEDINAILNVGDTIPVIVKEVGPGDRIGLSIKDRDPNFFASKLKNIGDYTNPNSSNNNRNNFRSDHGRRGKEKRYTQRNKNI